MARSKFCSKCGNEKEGSYKSGGYCKSCKLDLAKRVYTQQRIRGLKPFVRENRPETCADCGKIKERKLRFYCASCENKRARASYKRKYLTPEKVLLRKNIAIEKKKIAVWKKEVRRYTRVLIKMGKLIPQPCEDCGKVNVVPHHNDYDNPSDVKWLCKQCHHDEHKCINPSDINKRL